MAYSSVHVHVHVYLYMYVLLMYLLVGVYFGDYSYNHTEILIPHLGNLDVGDRTGKTALHHAAYNGHLEMLSLLLVKGANVKAMDRKEKSALHFAAFMGKWCTCK